MRATATAGLLEQVEDTWPACCASIYVLLCAVTAAMCPPLLCVVQVNLLPVVEEGGNVVGIVTRHDILRGLYASKNPLL